MRVFHGDQDYEAFLHLLDRACERLPMPVLAYCLMPNHFHLVLLPHGDGDLGRWMQWLLTSHVRRHHRRRRSSGHVWQGRFKAFPIQQDAHLVTVLRYVERNPVRAGLAERAEAWPWSSLRWWGSPGRPAFLSEWPIERPHGWRRLVNMPLGERDLAAVRLSVTRGRPRGDDRWTARIARHLGLESSLRPRGRPRKEAKK